MLHPCLFLRGTTSLQLPPSLVFVVVGVLWFLEVDTVSYSVLSLGIVYLPASIEYPQPVNTLSGSLKTM